MHLLLAGCETFPEGSLDTPELRPALEAAGLRVTFAPWTQSSPGDFDHCLLHTPWDYAWNPAEFRTWLEGWGERVINPLPVCQWNAHKSYLGELEAKGIPVVPCRPIRAGGSVDLAALARERGWSEVVVKPAIGQTARMTERAKANELGPLQAHAETLLSEEDILVQAFVPDIQGAGERSLVYLDGEYSHALEKRPAPGDWRVQDDYGGTVHPHVPTPEELEVAQAALAAAPGDLLYARVDLVSYAGTPRVIELELIEPELFLRLEPTAAGRLARGLARRLTGQR